MARFAQGHGFLCQKSAMPMGSMAERIERDALSWPGVTAQPQRFGGVEFRVNQPEIGHLHGDRLARRIIDDERSTIDD
jgi:hypothetical protein